MEGTRFGLSTGSKTVKFQGRVCVERDSDGHFHFLTAQPPRPYLYIRCPTERPITITTNNFVATPVADGEKLPEFDHSKLNCVVFDEVYTNSAYVLDRLGEFANTDPDKIITGVGDVQQLVLIEDLTNARKSDEYSGACINQIFDYDVMPATCIVSLY